MVWGFPISSPCGGPYPNLAGQNKHLHNITLLKRASVTGNNKGFDSGFTRITRYTAKYISKEIKQVFPMKFKNLII